MRRIDCDEVLQAVWHYLDGEVDETRYLEIRTHVEECAGCGPRYEFQRRLLMLIQVRCREGHRVPPAVRERLFKLLDSY